MSAMQLDVGGIMVDVMFKDIKNVHLSVYPPSGHVRISAPARMNLETIRVYVIFRLDWIKRQQKKLQNQARETPREYLERESHYLWGQRYLLQIEESGEAHEVKLKPGKMVLQVRPNAGVDKMQAVIAQFYRDQIKVVAAPLIEKWQPIMGVRVDRLYVQQMKTMWGSCNPRALAIRLNTELAKKPKHCLEYVVVHEMTHLLVPTHNDRFLSLMDDFMPGWRVHRDELNSYPLAHENWEY